MFEFEKIPLVLFAVVLLTAVGCSTATTQPPQPSKEVVGVISYVDYHEGPHGHHWGLDLALRTTEGREIFLYTGEHRDAEGYGVVMHGVPVSQIREGMRIRIRYSKPGVRDDRWSWMPEGSYWLDELWVLG